MKNFKYIFSIVFVKLRFKKYEPTKTNQNQSEITSNRPRINQSHAGTAQKTRVYYCAYSFQPEVFVDLFIQAAEFLFLLTLQESRR